MPRKLPLLRFGPGAASAPQPDAAARPTIDAMRKRLGGRASTEPGAGELVALTTAGGATQRGVVLFARGEVVDVWIDPPATAMPGGTVVRHARRADLAPLGRPAPATLDAVACDARAFGALLEGQRIRFQSDQGVGVGVLIEKCRFGALVERDDGAIVGVGFRRIWPAEAAKGGRN